MKTIFTMTLLFAVGTQAVSQDANESDRIKDLLSVLDQKALDARLQFDQLLNTYSKQHPKVKQFEAQLKSIAEAKAELASKLAMIELSDAHKELKNHASMLSKHLDALKAMLKAKVDDKFKNEYQQLYDHASKIKQRIEDHVEQKHQDVANNLKDLFSKANVNPQQVAKEYNQAMFNSLSQALATRRDQALAELQQARIAHEKSESINKDLQSRIIQLESRLAKEKIDADHQQQKALVEKRKVDETLSAYEDALRIADLKMKQFSADQLRMDKAIDAAKSIRMTSKDAQIKKLEELYTKLADVKNQSEQSTKSVDERLKKVESDVSKIKSMLEKVVDKIK